MDIASEAERNHPIFGARLHPEGLQESGSRCAYNLTKEHVLSLHVTTGDFPAASLCERLPTLTPRSGEGLWMRPFRGISAEDVTVPLDLIYLDAENRVIDVVEFFPTFRVSPSSPTAASVLVLPTHSIYSSQSQKGDQFLLCAAEELEGQLTRLAEAKRSATAPQIPVPAARVSPPDPQPAALAAQAPAPVQSEQPAEADATLEPQPAESARALDASRKDKRQSKGWFERWWSPEPADPRVAPRSLTPGMAAYFWTGAALEPHAIRNISLSGVYVVTEERWYPGTLVQLTLTKTDREAPEDKRFISLQGQVIRWGNDGVGLRFIVHDPRRPRRNHASHQEGIDPEELEAFLEPFLDANE